MTEPHPFAIRTDVFEGPLELLLDLIEKRKLLINDISLAAVTDEYMAYVSNLEEHPLRETSQFVLVAAALLLIKSKSLLPILNLTEEEEASIEDLEQRLKLYKLYADASISLKRQFGTRMLYERPHKADDTPLFLPDSYATAAKLHEAIGSVLANLPKKSIPKTKVAVRTIVSLEDMMKRLEERINTQFKTTFASFAGDPKERPQVIVSFLAVLELVKQGMVMVRQKKRFADFDIERERVDTPHYT